MIICWHDKTIIQIVKQQESFACCPATHYHEKKFMVPQNLQVKSQDIPVLYARCLEQEAALSQSAAGIF